MFSISVVLSCCKVFRDTPARAFCPSRDAPRGLSVDKNFIFATEFV